ncbi:large subunit ribosomal protein L21 [Arcanobacterium hippocoleae]|uniref:Large ribosomal subunit protein bL21 n=1 Tax=Arcanobacterium hippocoleae TaxID=149017 RepID=A0ABU1T418_9ACTO|nr:large subunit ribosomal protein L21 [Arcanobacterium hippocoleae]
MAIIAPFEVVSEDLFAVGLHLGACVVAYQKFFSAVASGNCNRIDRDEQNVVYAIVKVGGRQEKVSVDSVIVVNKMAGEAGDKVELEPIMLVDGDKVTTAADGISAKVTAEIVRDEKGPKINIVKYKNKTGYRKRQGHRQKLTRLKVTGIK